LDIREDLAAEVFAVPVLLDPVVEFLLLRSVLYFGPVLPVPVEPVLLVPVDPVVLPEVVLDVPVARSVLYFLPVLLLDPAVLPVELLDPLLLLPPE
jgi:hypothetical protein